MEGLSARASAAAAGVHPSTAFRWRHRLLNGLRVGEKRLLKGVAEAALSKDLEYHWRVKMWERHFRGISLKYLTNYLTWFALMGGCRTEERP